MLGECSVDARVLVWLVGATFALAASCHASHGPYGFHAIDVIPGLLQTHVFRMNMLTSSNEHDYARDDFFSN